MIEKKVGFWMNKSILFFIIFLTCCNAQAQEYAPFHFDKNGFRFIAENKETYYSQKDCEEFVSNHMQEDFLDEQEFWQHYPEDIHRLKIIGDNILKMPSWSYTYHCIPKDLVEKVGYQGVVLDSDNLRKLYPNMSDYYYSDSIFLFDE
jgi:hypothetical protein